MNKEEIIIDRVSMIDQWKTSGDVYTQDELNAIGELLDLYYKQQKEINKLKEQNKKYQEIEKLHNKIDELENADLTLVYMNGFYDGENKWKDKIRDKIKDLEINNNGDNYNLTNVVNILQELLGE